MSANTTTTVGTPEWMKPGTVVVVSNGSHGGGGIYRTTIERVTKTQIICEGDRRFTRRDLYAMKRSTWDTTKILDPSDPRTEVRWLEALQSNLRSGVGHEVEKLLTAFNRNGDVESIDIAIRYLTKAAVQYRARAAEITAAKEGPIQ